MPIYTQNSLTQLEIGALEVYDKYIELFFAYLQWPFTNPLAETMAKQGFCRRLKTLAYCVRTAFETIPLRSDAIPSDARLQECTV